MGEQSFKEYTESEECKSIVFQISEQQKVERQENQKILSQVKDMVSAKDFLNITEELSEGGFTDQFEIVSQPTGDIQDCEEGFEHGYRHVNQVCNGGYSGDDYAGDVYIPVSIDRWFKFSYSM
ncbi:hypothetical protein [Neptunomonas japonica]|uniref:hypothetical protein n=1 Tax=Neptunomonas japonica TaxID=417574 RepID=UPI0003F632B5|nr:hypothetical protein [Neptunomonas japonica]